MDPKGATYIYIYACVYACVYMYVHILRTTYYLLYPRCYNLNSRIRFQSITEYNTMKYNVMQPMLHTTSYVLHIAYYSCRLHGVC